MIIQIAEQREYRVETDGFTCEWCGEVVDEGYIYPAINLCIPCEVDSYKRCPNETYRQVRHNCLFRESARKARERLCRTDR